MTPSKSPSISSTTPHLCVSLPGFPLLATNAPPFAVAVLVAYKSVCYAESETRRLQRSVLAAHSRVPVTASSVLVLRMITCSNAPMECMWQ